MVDRLRELLETLRAFRSADILEGLTDTELAQVANIGQLVNYNAGDVIQCQGERQDFALVIGSGCVGLYLALGGEEIPVNILPSGRTIGISAFLPNPIAILTARALTPVQGLKLPRSALFNLMESNPRIGYEITKRLATIMIRRVRELYTANAALQRERL
jgi:CRP-like cAMP-binding protein